MLHSMHLKSGMRFRHVLKVLSRAYSMVVIAADFTPDLSRKDISWVSASGTYRLHSTLMLGMDL